MKIENKYTEEEIRNALLDNDKEICVDIEKIKKSKKTKKETLDF